MPTYTFRDDTTGKEWDDFMSISAMETYLAENPHIHQVPKSVQIMDPWLLQRPTDGFRDILKEIRKKHRSAVEDCKINTW